MNSVVKQQTGAVEACWAHNPEVRGSKPRSANIFCYQYYLFCDEFEYCINKLTEHLESGIEHVYGEIIKY